MKIYITLLLLLPFQLSFAQLDWKEDTFDGIANSDKKVVFFDDFSTTNAFWKKSDFEKTITAIENGKCKLSSVKSEQMIWQELVMDKDGFELEIKISSEKNKTGEPLKIILAGSKDDYLTFELKPEGSYTSNVVRGDVVTPLINECKSTAINIDANIVTIRKIDKSIYFFVNGQLLASRVFPPLSGYRFGVATDTKNSVLLEYFLMSDLIKSRRNADFNAKDGEDNSLIDREEKGRYKMKQ